MFEIRNYEQEPIVLIRPATVQELAAYETWKKEKTKEENKENLNYAKI